MKSGLLSRIRQSVRLFSEYASNQVCFKNLSLGVTLRDLKNVCKTVGPVTKAHLTETSTGAVGFVTFRNEIDAIRALDELSALTWKGLSIEIESVHDIESIEEINRVKSRSDSNSIVFPSLTSYQRLKGASVGCAMISQNH